MSRRLRFLKAYWSVLAILSSYLFLSLQKRFLGESWVQEKTPIVHRRNARRIERSILDLKGLFIKMGQMLSIMSNFLPEALTQGLEGLQDSVPPHPYEAIEKRFQEEFGKNPRELFERFEGTPIASASLGQVHVAYLKDGTKVAVKVQYPEIDEIVKSDLKTLKRIFGLLHLFFPVYGLKSVYREIAEVILKELDYGYEGKNLEVLKKNFESEKDFLFPDVFWDLSSRKILTLRFMEGTKISAVEELKRQGIDPSQVARRIIDAYCKQIFIDGVYHADPHPGNLLVQKGESETEPKIVLVDFGATARISERMRHGITLFAEGVIKRDTKALANAMREMGFIVRPASEGVFEPFEQLVDYFYEKLSNIKIENFRQINLSQLSHLEDLLELRKIKISFRDLMTSFHVPKDWILLERTLLLIMGLCALLDPKLNPVEIVLPYVEKFVLKDKPLREVAIAVSKQLLLSYIQLPGEIQKTLRRLNEGSLTLQIKGLEAHTRKLYVLGHQILYAGLGATGIFISLLCRWQGAIDYAHYAFYGSLFFGGVLAVSFLRNRA
jgi:predicted unusual protein kinase regulating ubiquinone biosynthesis (AarF/ABC1/UbiB family)